MRADLGGPRCARPSPHRALAPRGGDPCRATSSTSRRIRYRPGPSPPEQPPTDRLRIDRIAWQDRSTSAGADESRFGIINAMNQPVPPQEPSNVGEPRVLRPLTAADLDELLQVQERGAVAGLGHIFPQEQFPFPAAAVRARWEQELSDPGIDCFAITGETGAIAGFAATRGDEFLHFGTAVSSWGTGLAARAHDEVLNHFARQGHPSARLAVFEANERARRFYERRGWTLIAERSRSPFPPHAVLVRYCRALDAALS